MIAAGLTGAAALGAAAVTARGDAARTRHAAGTLAPGDSSPVVDPDAVAALDKMGNYLRTLKAVQIKAVVTDEEVSLDGEKVQTTNTVDLLASRPNRMRVEVASERQPRVFYYDGKTFTLWAPKLDFYAKTDAPGTINELADRLSDKYNIDLPLVDLFRWGTPESGFKELTAATDMGPSSVDGTTCEQYVFRQDGLDWQLWIQSGDYPLPRKLVLTTTTDDARPQHTSVWTWNLAPSFNDQEFAFTPPAGAHRIEFLDAEKLRALGATGGAK